MLRAFQKVLAAIAVVVGASTLLSKPVAAAELLKPNCSTQFFTQAIDHNDTSSGTFQQQYQILSTHFKPGGPIIYYQQAETSTMACMVSEKWGRPIPLLTLY